MKVNVDMEAMNLGELDFIEQESGLGINDLAAGKMTTRALLAIIVVQERRKNANYSMDDARSLKIGEIEVEVADPTEPSTTPSGKSKAASS